MHIIVVGGGEMGYRLSQALATAHDVFVVDPDPVTGERFADADVEFVAGSGASPDVLRRAGIERCGVLIAATRLDEVNFVCCALASKLGGPRTVCFASREDLLTAGARGLQQHFGIDEVIWPEAELAAHMERVVLAPGATDAGVFVGGRIELLEYRLGDGSPLALPVPHYFSLDFVKPLRYGGRHGDSESGLTYSAGRPCPPARRTGGGGFGGRRQPRAGR